MSPLNPLSNNYLQSILSAALQGTGLSANNSTANPNSVSTASVAAPDNSQFSPVANLMNTLQQLQQSNPTEYQQVTQQIATNLQTAAQTAQSQGNTAAANQLNQLASIFSQASQTGQLPSAQDLLQAVGGHHHHHGHHHADSSSDSTSSTSSTTDTTGTASSSTTSSTNPFQIIFSTLANAGVTVPGSTQT
jgi:hypothetical protein